MDAIYNNSNNINLLNNNSKDITLINNKSITDENSNKNNVFKYITKTDFIEISEKDKNKINKKKASDAFQESCSEFSQNTGSKMGVEYFMIVEMMKIKGIDVPSFNPNDNTNTNGFLPFIDKMKEFVNKENITSKGVPMDKTKFLDFCDLYKEKLVKYGCK